MILACASRIVIMKAEMSLTKQATDVVLADHTTLRVGGPAPRMITVETETELVQTIRDLDATSQPLLVLGGGSNLLISDAGFDGTVVKIATRGLDQDTAACSGAVITVAAGEPWDPVVRHTIERGWSGLEAMSGIPGLIGATPIQNVGAYGAEVSEMISMVRTLDRSTGHLKTFFPIECGFGYRTSRFKSGPGRFVVLSVTFQLRLGALSQPIRYAELARALGVEIGERAPAADVRQAVLELRNAKGMVLVDDDHDTWSVGSFFTNPIVSQDTALALPAGAPRFSQPDGMVKTSAAWLIEQAGFAKGYGHGAARLSGKHTLALTNRGGATAEDLLSLAREIRSGVEAKFGIELVPEPVLVGCEL